MRFLSEKAKYTPFLKWWLMFCMMIMGSVVAFDSGVFNSMWVSDITKLSFLILLIFTLSTIWCGIQTWKVGKIDHHVFKDESAVGSLKRASDIGWFFSDISMSIGMVGTVIGFIVMLSGFSTIDIAEQSGAQELFKNLSIGMSTALYTTLSGLICGSLLKLQFFNLDHSIGKAEEE